jgi:NAD(P)-dependent dehydrogenase (short-subunit alcohol dehydrogenase family)
MGQMNVIRAAQERVGDGGSATVTSGTLATKPMLGSAALSLVNAGLEGFVRAAELDMPRGMRVNVVSPAWVKETMRAMQTDETGGCRPRTLQRHTSRRWKARRTATCSTRRASPERMRARWSGWLILPRPCH